MIPEKGPSFTVPELGDLGDAAELIDAMMADLSSVPIDKIVVGCSPAVTPEWQFQQGICVLPATPEQGQARCNLFYNQMLFSCMADENDQEIATIPLALVNQPSSTAPKLCLGDTTWCLANGADALLESPQIFATLSRMLQAEIWRVLEESGLSVKVIECMQAEGAMYDFDVQVEYYFDRDLEKTGGGFHKDSLGMTMFVCLAFVNQLSLVGPEFILDVKEGLWEFEEKMPGSFMGHIGQGRASSSQLLAPKQNKIRMSTLGYCATACFTDSMMMHASPSLQTRGHPYLFKTGEFLVNVGDSAKSFDAPHVERKRSLSKGFAGTKKQQAYEDKLEMATYVTPDEAEEFNQELEALKLAAEAPPTEKESTRAALIEQTRTAPRRFFRFNVRAHRKDQG